MKRSDLGKAFTELVTKYIADGYMINPDSMSGSQGEIAKVDLVKGDLLIRIWMDTDYSLRWAEDQWQGKSIIIRVGSWSYPANSRNTVWMSDIEEIEKIVYYEISSDFYVDTLDEALTYQKRRKERRQYRPIEQREIIDMTPVAREIAKRYLKRKVGYQRVCESDIVLHKSVKGEDVRYIIRYKGHHYKLR